MKHFTKLKGKLTWINASVLVFFLLAFQNCGDDSTTTTTCTGCDTSSPWSTPSSSSYYSTLSACQSALGSGCVYCH